jgi:hypothetical protein
MTEIWQKVLIYDIVRKVHLPAGIAAVDSFNCYDCIAHVGTLPKGYRCNVPLLRVPLQQSPTSQVQHTIPDYYELPYVAPMYTSPCSIVESAAYAFSPAWHAIAINT